MRTNLIEALRDEAILLVLDQFEPNLETVDAAGGRKSADPEWDALLGELVRELPSTRSRALITSRLMPAALSGAGVVDIELTPLPRDEARLFIWTYDQLSALMIADAAGYNLGARLLARAAGDPGELARLSAMAADRAALAAELARLDQLADNPPPA
jgi:hypothetical protein